jgi:ATP-dependent Clp protease adaptor protein ClpS
MPTDAKTEKDVQLDREEDSRAKQDRPWNVILWNDHVNMMAYVVFVLQRIFGYSQEQAAGLMLEAHHNGKAVVATEARERAELHAAQLHGFGLQATIARAS